MCVCICIYAYVCVCITVKTRGLAGNIEVKVFYVVFFLLVFLNVVVKCQNVKMLFCISMSASEYYR